MRDGTDTAEMLELIGKVTASLSDRMDEHGKTLEDIRSLARKADRRTPARPSPKDREALESVTFDLRMARNSIDHLKRNLTLAENQAKSAETRARNWDAQCRSLEQELEDRRAFWRRWKRLILPVVFAVLIGLILPTFLARSSLGCTAMRGTWGIYPDSGNSYCYFLGKSNP